MYTAVDIPAGGLVVGSTMPAIPHFFGPRKDGSETLWSGNDYVWSGHIFEARIEAFPHFEEVMIGGLLGCLSNANAGIKNLKIDTGKYEPVLDRCFDPGAGAFSSDYIDCSVRSAHPVTTGDDCSSGSTT